MTTAPPTLVALQAKLSQIVGTINLGIVGDASHIATGGYHIGAASLRAHGMGGDYSLQYAKDQVSHDYACAIDLGGSAAGLMTIGDRLVHSLQTHDPRVYGHIRGVNAPWGGQSIDRRYESPTDQIQSSDDRNHVHIEIYRSLVLDQATMDGLFDVIAGYGSSPAPAPAPPASSNPLRGQPVPSIIRQGSGQYFGSYSGPAASHGGFNASERPYIKLWQQFLIWAQCVPGHSNINDGWADGIYDNKTDKPNTGPTSQATAAFQKAHRPNNTSAWGQCWWDDWTTASQM